MTALATFRALHRADRPLVLVNAWDAFSAALVQRAGGQAIATSSAALAWSLGYPDDHAFDRQVFVGAVERIRGAVSVPVTADVEDGFSDDPAAVARFVQDLVKAGACGINLEDGTGSPEQLQAKIRAIRAALGGDVFINARIDVLLRGLPFDDREAEVLRRAKAYQAAGADGLFLPGTADRELFARLGAAVALPWNAMLGKADQPISAFDGCGVSRVSTGILPSLVAYSALDAFAARLLDGGNGKASSPLTFGAANSLFTGGRTA